MFNEDLGNASGGRATIETSKAKFETVVTILAGAGTSKMIQKKNQIRESINVNFSFNQQRNC